VELDHGAGIDRTACGEGIEPFNGGGDDPLIAPTLKDRLKAIVNPAFWVTSRGNKSLVPAGG